MYIYKIKYLMANQEKRSERVRVIGENGGFRKGNYPCQQIWAQEWDLPETAAGWAFISRLGWA
jgi:hypothetical protein